MSLKPKDPLLVAGKVMTTILMALTGLVTIILIGVVPVLLFNQGEFATAVAEAGGDNVGMALAAAILLLAIAALVTAAAFHFFQLLGRIIGTVSAQDPFTSDNAQRLGRMGWIALAFQIASFPIGALAVYLADFVPEENLTIDYEFSLTGLLLAIVLFILARIFRHGAAMREDLEGTV
ncbi:MAG: DUF2975 domain-containing protein [Erythrobacter sp.]